MSLLTPLSTPLSTPLLTPLSIPLSKPIPNIFHFINIGPREFNMMHFLSIYTAYIQNKPDKIYVYVDHEQKNNIYWEILKDIVEYTYITPPTHYNNIELNSYHYKADIIRMEKLIEHGGIYMDLDILSLKPLTHLLGHKLVLGSEASDDPNSIKLEEFKSITNAVIMSEPNNPFIKDWYKEIGNNLVGKPWAYHAVCLPKDMLMNNPGKYDVHLEPSKTFMPFCFRYPYIWDDNQISKKDCLEESYTIHLWENIWSRDYISQLSVSYFKNRTNIMTILFRDNMKILSENKNKIQQIISNCVGKDNDKALYYMNMLKQLS
jgi:hypothetical protein